MNEQRKTFVVKCGELLREAKPHLIRCELVWGKDIPPNPLQYYVPNEEYVLVTCENGYTYKLPIEGNSLCAIAAEVFVKMQYK